MVFFELVFLLSLALYPSFAVLPGHSENRGGKIKATKKLDEIIAVFVS